MNQLGAGAVVREMGNPAFAFRHVEYQPLSAVERAVHHSGPLWDGATHTLSIGPAMTGKDGADTAIQISLNYQNEEFK